MKKINRDNLGNQSEGKPLQSEQAQQPDLSGSPEVPLEQEPIYFEQEFNLEQGSEIAQQGKQKKTKKPKKEKQSKPKGQAASSKSKIKTFLIAGGALVTLLILIVVVVSAVGKDAPTVETVANEVEEVEEIVLETDFDKDDVSGLMTLEERNKVRTFETITDSYLDMRMEVPSDYFVTEKTHLDLGVITDAGGSGEYLIGVSKDTLDGTVSVVELKSKVYADYSIYLQINHIADYPPEEQLIVSDAYSSKTNRYFATKKFFNRGDVLEKMAKEQAEEGAETAEVVKDETVVAEKVDKAKEEVAKEEATKKAEEKKVVAEPKPVQAELNHYYDKDEHLVKEYNRGTKAEPKYTTVSEYYDDKGVYTKVTERHDGKRTEYTETLLEHGNILAVTKEFDKRKLISVNEVLNVPFYLASKSLDTFVQIRDYSLPKACFDVVDSLYKLQQEKMVETDQTEESVDGAVVEATVEGEATKEEDFTTVLDEEAVKAEQDKEKKEQTKKNKTYLTAEELKAVEPVVSYSSKLEMLQNGSCGGTVEETTEEQQEKEVVVDTGELALEDVFTAEQLALLSGTAETTDVIEVDEVPYTQTFINNQRDIGNYWVKVKKVDIKHLVTQAPYEAYEFSFLVGVNEVYVTVVGKDAEELYYILEDAENIIKTLQF